MPRKLTTLTPEQNRVWTKLFEQNMNDGRGGKESDRRAWVGLCEQFPELKQFDGCRP